MSMLDETNLNASQSRIYRKKYYRLNQSLAKVIDEYSLVRFQPFDVSDEESINDVLIVIDNILQYGEDQEVKEPRNLHDDEDGEEPKDRSKDEDDDDDDE